jgi:DNA-binding response OmpR family regulator
MRVLLVDDEERMVAALRRGLTAEGFVTESAGDGLTGLALARDGDFDAVVLDVMLPGSPATRWSAGCARTTTGCPC